MMEIDIQIYITSIRNFFETNEEARRQMFNIPYADEEMFYEGLVEVATKNFETELKDLIDKDMVKIVDVNKDGTPILKVISKDNKESEVPEGPFQEIQGYGFMGLN